ncbi:MAG: DUF924 family protein [Pseudomonadales bacterium]|nr:DUF924 family protein [Pseudomonadales bacterium]
MSPPDPRVAALLDGWFGALADGFVAPEVRQRWFRADPAFDEWLRARFGDDVEAALAGDRDAWGWTPEGRLGLVLLLDQLPRNLFRGTARAFAGDARALAAARVGVGRGDDRLLPPEQRVFLYLPFEHAEHRADQETAVVLLERLRDELEDRPQGRSIVADYLRHAREHRAIVRRFGRFPHRNAALGRASTEEERAWLETDGRAFGQQRSSSPAT